MIDIYHDNDKQAMPLSTVQSSCVFKWAHCLYEVLQCVFWSHGPAFDLFYLCMLLGNAAFEVFVSSLQRYEEPLLSDNTTNGTSRVHSSASYSAL